MCLLYLWNGETTHKEGLSMDMPTYLYEYMDALQQIDRWTKQGMSPQVIADRLNAGRAWLPEDCAQWTAELVRKYTKKEERSMSTQQIMNIVKVAGPIAIALVVAILEEYSKK
jgi:hypothetical protein